MKHDGSHKLNVACLDCIRVHLEQKAKLIEFVKRVQKHSCCACAPECCIACDALELLREIGECK